MHDLVIKNGMLITPAGLRRADLAVDGESIAAIAPTLAGRRIINAAGCYLLPGGVDQHVHLQMPLAGRVSTDDFVSGTRAAACGGTTTIIDFVTPEPEQAMADALAQRRAEADGRVLIDYGLHMTIPTWHGAEDARLSDVPAMVAAGCATFKLYQAYPGMMLDDVSLLRAFRAIAAAGGRAVLHSETGPVLDQLRDDALAAGHTDPIWHERTRPAELEATAVARAIALAAAAGCPLMIFHVGCAASVDAIAAARRHGDVTGESCPQYLTLTAEEQLGGPDGQLYICAPPLRSRHDQNMVWRALAEGTLDVVSTDHCPWTRAEKHQPDFAAVPGGVPSIEARLALLHHCGVRSGRLSLTRWVALCAANPARLMGLQKKGILAVGFDADIVIFDPAARHMLGVETMHEAADWTPYQGTELHGWPRTVLLRGRIIVEDERPTETENHGRYLLRML
jgi:dihydropyrimidinase